MTPEAWKRLAASLSYYTDPLRGYVYQDAPWLVGPWAYSKTKPEGALDLEVSAWPGRYLAASGEQGFLELAASGYDLRDVVTLTPCFRDEPFYSNTHLRGFMKTELWSTTKTVSQVLDHALGFFGNHVPKSELLVETTDIGYDITLRGYELGSYGRRTVSGITYVYGTGLAEPRFDYALSH